MDPTVTSADGSRLAVRRLGHGRPVVFLHGSGGGLDSWAEVAELLAPEFQSWLVARRGYHPSDVPAAAKSFDQEIADVDAVVREAQRESGEPVHLVGGSYGATLALHFVRGRNGTATDVASLSIFEPPLFAAGPELRAVVEDFRTLLNAGDFAAANLLVAEKVAQVPPAVLTALAALAPSDEGDAESGQAQQEAVGTLHDLEALAGDSLDVQRWKSVDLPVLLMQGADTWEPMPTTMDALAAVLPVVERVIWRGQSHFATATAPGLVADTLRDFLRRH